MKTRTFVTRRWCFRIDLSRQLKRSNSWTINLSPFKKWLCPSSKAQLYLIMESMVLILTSLMPRSINSPPRTISQSNFRPNSLKSVTTSETKCSWSKATKASFLKSKLSWSKRSLRFMNSLTESGPKETPIWKLLKSGKINSSPMCK